VPLGGRCLLFWARLHSGSTFRGLPWPSTQAKGPVFEDGESKPTPRPVLPIQVVSAANRSRARPANVGSSRPGSGPWSPGGRFVPGREVVGGRARIGWRGRKGAGLGGIDSAPRCRRHGLLVDRRGPGPQWPIRQHLHGSGTRFSTVSLVYGEDGRAGRPGAARDYRD